MNLSASFSAVVFVLSLLSTAALQVGSKVHQLPSARDSVPSNNSRGDAAQTRTQLKKDTFTYWRYTPINFMPVRARKAPDMHSTQEETIINPGAILKVSQELQHPEDEVLYLQLADGGGWLFDKKPGFGTMCTREKFMDAGAFIEARATEIRRTKNTTHEGGSTNAKQTATTHSEFAETSAEKEPVASAPKATSRVSVMEKAEMAKASGEKVSAKIVLTKNIEGEQVLVATKSGVSEKELATTKQTIVEKIPREGMKVLPAKKMFVGDAKEESINALGPPLTKAAGFQQLSGNKSIRESSSLRKTVEEQAKSSGLPSGNLKAFYKPLKAKAAEKPSTKQIEKHSRGKTSAHQATEEKAVGPSPQRVDSFERPLTTAGVRKSVNRTRLGLMQQSATQGMALATEQEMISLNVTAPELIEAGLKMALPAVFGLAQVNATTNKMTLCRDGHLPTLLHTGQYTCDILYAEGSTAYYINNILKLLSDLYNLSRVALLFWCIVFALLGTYVVEVFVFRRRKPYSEVIGCEFDLPEQGHSGDNVAKNSPAEPDMKKGGNDTLLGTPSVKQFKQWTMSPEEPSVLVPDHASTRSWSFSQFVRRFVPQPWQCRRRQKPA